MNWKNIKTFLIILFLIINIYLIYSQYGLNFRFSNASYINKDTLNDSISIIKNNYNIKLNRTIIPEKITKLGIIDVTNIIYTDKFEKSGYNFETKGATFKAHIETETYSYNETNAKSQFINILNNIGIEKQSYAFDVKKTDEGLVCTAKALIGPYDIFNARIKAVFTPKKINLSGTWFVAENGALEKNKKNDEMADIPSMLIDMANWCADSDASQKIITDFSYGYYVSSYDEKSASKTSSAIPCYMLKTDEGIKYYYDSLNGKRLKQEE